MIKSIRIPARWIDDYDDSTVHGKAHFNLGLGPCGKTVSKLELLMGSKFVTVVQICLDGPEKRFYYRHKDITGRIEVEYT